MVEKKMRRINKVNMAARIFNTVFFCFIVTVAAVQEKLYPNEFSVKRPENDSSGHFF